ncbi:MAG: GNAT family N-acetyltransferase [Actinomycetota bacterium]|nr:GNAT family N-acetyltransferase [Actinomycetota bacterium]
MTGSPDRGASVHVRRARIEEIRPLAEAYRDESSRDTAPSEPPQPAGGIFWIAEEPDGGEPLGYAGGTLRPGGLTIGPVYVRPASRRRRIGVQLLGEVQRWAARTRIPVVEVSVAVENDEGRAFLEACGYMPRRILFSPTPEARPDAPAVVADTR